MRRPPPPHPRGEPRTAGSGRKKGTPNRRTVQMRELMTSLCHDVGYQYNSARTSDDVEYTRHRELGMGAHRREARRAGPVLR